MHTVTFAQLLLHCMSSGIYIYGNRSVAGAMFNITLYISVGRRALGLAHSRCAASALRATINSVWTVMDPE